MYKLVIRWGFMGLNIVPKGLAHFGLKGLISQLFNRPFKFVFHKDKSI